MAQQERAVRTRHKILVAAAEVFDEVGYEAATISEILRRSGVTKGALYFHFASKEDLAQGILAKQFSAVPQVPRQPLVLQEALDTSLLLAYLLSTGDPMVRGSVRLTVELGGREDVLDRRVPLQAWIESNAAYFEKAQRAGEILPHVDVMAAAKLGAGAFTGVQVVSKIMTGHADLMERVVELLKHLMASMAAPAVLVELEISEDRAKRVLEEATRQGGEVAQSGRAADTG